MCPSFEAASIIETVIASLALYCSITGIHVSPHANHIMCASYVAYINQIYASQTALIW